MGAKFVGHDYNRDLWLQPGSHQHKSVTDTLAEEDGLPYTAAFTLSDADTDLWHTGSRKPLSQRGPVNQGHFVGFRCPKKLHIYNCAWSQPPSSPRRQQHLVEIKRRTFPNSWPAPVLSFNNRMNELRTAEGIKKHYARPFFFFKRPFPTTTPPGPTTQFPCIRFIQRRWTLLWRVPSHCSADTDDSFTNILRNDPAETLRKCL